MGNANPDGVEGAPVRPVYGLCGAVVFLAIVICLDGFFGPLHEAGKDGRLDDCVAVCHEVLCNDLPRDGRFLQGCVVHDCFQAVLEVGRVLLVLFGIADRFPVDSR